MGVASGEPMLACHTLSLTAKASLLLLLAPAPKFIGTPRKGIGTVFTE